MATSLFEPLEQEDVFHGVRVPDPYRWLEDRSLPETEAWILEQKQHCDDYFGSCPVLPEIRSRVQSLLDVEVIDQPVRIGSRYFYRRRFKGEEQASIFVRDLTTDEEVLLVPAQQDPFVSVRLHRISPNGHFLAYEVRYGGTDRRTIHAIEVASGVTLDTDVSADWFRGLVFDESKRGFYYCEDVLGDNAEHTVRWHSFEPYTNCGICFRCPLTSSSRLVLTCDEIHIGAMYLHREHEDEILDFWIAKLDDVFPVSWHRVFHEQRLRFCPVLSQGRIFAKTSYSSSSGRYAEFDRNGMEIRTVVPEQTGRLCQTMLVRDGLLTHRFHEGKSEVHWWNLNGDDLGILDVPSNMSATLLPPLAGAQESLFLSCESFATAPSIYEFNVADGKVRAWSESPVPRLHRPTNVRRENYSSVEGTSIPITLVSLYQDEQKPDGPCLMTAYGGFGVPGTPQFSVLVSLLLEAGATFVLPHIRGGGDFGTAWHDAGRGRRRQTSIDDFLAAGAWLKHNGFASTGLAIFGGSNSGLLVGAAITQRPELFRAALCIAPLLDMVRYECFDRAARWRSEYGSAGVKEEFLALYRYSPYHRVEKHVNYPATLFVTGDSDDRCNPAHVRKMAAALQDRDAQVSPILVDYSEMRGHMPVLPLSVRIEALTKRIAFLYRELNLNIPPRK